MTATIKLHTLRLVLRRHVAEDAEILHRVFGLDEAMYRYSGWNPYATADLAEEKVQDFIRSYSREDFYGWAIEQAVSWWGPLGPTILTRAQNPSKSDFQSAVSWKRQGWCLPARNLMDWRSAGRCMIS